MSRTDLFVICSVAVMVGVFPAEQARAGTDQRCVSDCTSRGYAYQLCEQKCTFAEAPAPEMKSLDLGHVLLTAQQIRAMREQREVQERLLQTEQAVKADQKQAAQISQAEADIRFMKYLDQVNACIALGKVPNESDSETCINRLKVTDPDFAGSWAEQHSPEAQAAMSKLWMHVLDQHPELIKSKDDRPAAEPRAK